MIISYAVEGQTDTPVADKLIRLVGGTPRRILVAGGKTKLDPKVPGLNGVAQAVPWLVLRDLDDDADCAPDLVDLLLDAQVLSDGMCLRIAERATESWLLADSVAFSEFFRITISRIPNTPDVLQRPKRQVVDLCRRSTRSSVRKAMVPRVSSGREVGPEYVSFLIDFARNYWDPSRAADRSPSLRRAIVRMASLVEDGNWA